MADRGDSGGTERARSSECMPCAGGGVVISKLGGEEHEVGCPWCGGTGRRQEGVDAQARWLAERDPSSSGDDAPAAV
ncbi:MAG: hypothetical protein ACYCUM_04740 [Solirubrobacteraceae bacterium]